MGAEGRTTGFVKALNTKKGLQVAEEADFMCGCLEYYGIDLINGGTSTNYQLAKLFDNNFFNPFASESVIDYALEHDMLIEVEDTSAKKSLILPVRVGPSKKIYTYNPFWNTGMPAELLEYGNDKSIKNSSPRARIDEIKNMISLSYEDLDRLQEEYNKFVMDIESLHNEIATSGKPIADRLNDKGFSIGSVETETMANQIELIRKAKSVVDGYSNDKLQMILDLDSNEFSDNFYDGKTIGGYMDADLSEILSLNPKTFSDTPYDDTPKRSYIVSDLSENDINAYRKHLKELETAEHRKEFFKSAMNKGATS